jgi:hypothetical protein
MYFEEENHPTSSYWEVSEEEELLKQIYLDKWTIEEHNYEIEGETNGK